MAAKLLKNNNLSIQQARADLQIVDQIVSAIENKIPETASFCEDRHHIISSRPQRN